MIDEKYIEAWRNKEAAYLLIGNYEQVIMCSDNILKINPMAENLWINRGALMVSLHRYKEAIECFDKALEINPKSRYAKYKRDEVVKILSPEKTKEVIRLTKKICLLGDPGVGKTSLIKKYVYDIFEDRYISSIGTKITKKMLSLKYMCNKPNILLTLMIWDMAGQDDFYELRAIYYQGADGAIIVCDVTRKETLYNVNSWINGLFKVTEKVPIIMLANKNDLKVQASFTDFEIKNISEIIGSVYFFTSAKTGENVENAFATISRYILETK